jgi:predicted nucleotidyltransferase
MKEITPIIQAILNHHPDIQAIYLFGSYGTDYERPESDVDIALLLSPAESKTVGSPLAGKLHLELEQLLNKDVDLINLRQVSTVLQKEVVAANRCIYQSDKYASEEFEMLALSQYQKLNEERSDIVENALAGGRFH